MSEIHRNHIRIELEWRIIQAWARLALFETPDVLVAQGELDQARLELAAFEEAGA